jgi:Domain of unknown function (DUF1883)
MKYIYYDVGEQPQDACVVAHLRGSAANVILLDSGNFDRYRLGLPFDYAGGLCARTPARLRIPRDGHWYLVIDCGGYRHRVSVENVEVLTADRPHSAGEVEPDTPLVGANSE